MDCVGYWSGWSNCLPCGGGTQSRTYTVITPAERGGTPCVDELVQSRDCNTPSCPELVDELAAHIGDGTCNPNLLYALQQDPAEFTMIELPSTTQWPTFDEAKRAGDTAMAAQQARGGARSSRQPPGGNCDSIGHPELVDVHDATGGYYIRPESNEEYLRSYECYCTSNLLREMADCAGTMDVGTPQDITGQSGASYHQNWIAYKQHCDYWGQPDNQQTIGELIGRWPALR